MFQIECYVSALLVLLLLKNLEFSQAELYKKQLTIFAEAGRQECYHQPIAASENIKIDYQVIHGGHGEPHINFNLMDPGRRLLVTDVKQAKATHNLVARETGSYKLCFDNTISSFNQKIVAFTLVVTAADKEEQARRTLRKEMLTEYQFDLAYTSIDNSIAKVRVNFDRARQTQDFIRTIEARDRHVAECNFERVNLWSCVHLSAMIIVGCMQVIMLRSIFSLNGRLYEFWKRF
ncbi:hypothetical protein KR054_002425 [Drosophila jambulina]|nr:hypothetical protein KR054_002425 [Drosophila jambulina]